MILWIGVLILLLLPGWGAAEDGYCGDANGVTELVHSVDRTLIIAQGCFALPKGATLSNTALLIDNPLRHLKVVTGVLTRKTQAERDAADAALAAQQAAEATRQATLSAALGNQACNNVSVATIDARIDALENLSDLRTFLKLFVKCVFARRGELQP